MTLKVNPMSICSLPVIGWRRSYYSRTAFIKDDCKKILLKAYLLAENIIGKGYVNPKVSRIEEVK